MLVRYWQAAVLAALAALMGDVVWAQETWPQGGFATGYAPPGVSLPDQPSCGQVKCGEATTCCEKGVCGTEAKCGQESDCCKEGKCCKANKCDCAKGDECCCKKGECKCNKSNCCKGVCLSCRAIPAKETKSTTIIVVMPSPSMFGACHPELGLMQPHPAHVMLPCPLPPPPPMLSPPGIPMMPPQMVGMPMPSPYYSCPAPTCVTKANTACETCATLLNLACELSSAVRPLSAPSMCASAMEMVAELCAPPIPSCPQYIIGSTPPCCGGYSCAAPTLPQPSCDIAYSCAAPTLPQPTVVPCAMVSTPSTKLHIVAKPSSDQLEMSVGEDSCLRCKKMTVTIGDNEIIVSRFDDRVRIRGDELKATADSVRSERKDRIILEGDVVLHYKKDGHCANVTGDRIELNLSSGAVTIKPAAKPAPAVHIKSIDADSK